ncbi:MAG: cysteine--tRNA ligase [Candidatus Moranbacteria bacterium]|nr:cysteine--tRNA ligase [Candidatus Moranbacteria bacterium]
MSQKMEVLETITPGKINFFVCGPTVYDMPHLGHAKTYIQFDAIVRYLRFRGFEVFYLQNITDIDDKIITRAAEQGIGFDALARKFEAVYLEDMTALHVTGVTKYIRSTDYIEEVVSQVERLMAQGFAYQTSDGIYFEIAKFADYGKLSKRNDVAKDDAVSRIDASSEKRGWNDFCLWKNSKEGEPSWETRIGTGRPGWHIEDTAMTEKFFGPQYDIHGGAVDLIFPHHEAELTQMEALSGKSPFVRHWMHTGFLNIDSEKMSKSKGNFKTIREALVEYDYRVLRLFFISSQYRSMMDFSKRALLQAKQTLTSIDEFVFRIDREYDDAENELIVMKLREDIVSAMENDFNTPQVFAALFEFMKVQSGKKSGKRVFSLFQELQSFLDIFQLDGESEDEEIEKLIEKRNAYRAEGNYAEADVIRDQLLAMGIKLYDENGKTKYRR